MSQESPGLPGLVDLQVNGYAGVDFNSPDLDLAAVEKVALALKADGVVLFLPTLISNSAPRLLASAQRLAAASRQISTAGATIAGIHLEGPFIAPEDGPRGAHPADFVIDPDLVLIEEIFQASGGQLKILTLAPERPGAIALIEWCMERGVKAAIGHTAASSADIVRAVHAGASLSTHLGNGCHGLLPRHPNCIWDQLAEGDLWASMIADGFHLPAAVMKVFARIKQDRLLLVSDATALTGLPAGIYDSFIGGRVALSAQGRLSVAGSPDLLAGAATPLRCIIARLAAGGVLSYEQAWQAASTNAARFLGLSEIPELAPGFLPMRADPANDSDLG